MLCSAISYKVNGVGTRRRGGATRCATSLAELRAALDTALEINVRLRELSKLPAAALVSQPAAAEPEPAGPPNLPAPAATDPVWPTAGEEFWLRPPWRDAGAVSAPRAAAGAAAAAPLRVVHVACEMAPWAKVGGLADVVTGLSRSCLQQGHDVSVVLPHYSDGVDAAACTLGAEELQFDVPMGRSFDGELRYNTVRTVATSGLVAGVSVTLLRPAGGPLAERMFKGPYGSKGGLNVREASLYFCRAALEYLCCRRGGVDRPDVLHAHEWQACALPMLYWTVFRGCLGSAVVLTIHNADSPGECRADEFAACGADGAEFMTLERALDERTVGHNPERLSLLKGGVVFANAVTTVSRTYREESMRGGWLGGVLSAQAGKYTGIVNGLDTAAWDPASDPFLPFPYVAAAMAGKAACKRWLQAGLGLPQDAGVPLVIAVSRLVSQKGIGALMHAARRAAPLGYQFVLLGTGAQDGPFRAMAAQDSQYGGEGAASRRLLLRYSEPLAHLMFAAGDITLVPSLFEPCGLTQLVGQRYGAVPLVRRTGGLADTVADGETGFVIDGADETAVESGLARALATYASPAGEWARLVQRCMALDVSWTTPSEQYISLYRHVMAAVRG